MDNKTTLPELHYAYSAHCSLAQMQHGVEINKERNFCLSLMFLCVSQARVSAHLSDVDTDLDSRRRAHVGI